MNTSRSRRLVISALIARTLFLFAFFYTVYYFVPAYKKITEDFPVNTTVSWRLLISISDWVVIQSHSDAIFPILLAAFLVSTVALSLIFLIRSRSTGRLGRLPVLSAIGSLTCCVILFAVTSEHVRRIIEIHPEVLEYNIWYVNMFA